MIPHRDIGQAKIAFQRLEREAQARNRKLRLRKPPRFAAPLGIERDYMTTLRRFIEKDANAIRSNIVGPLEGILREHEILLPDSAQSHSDNIADKIRQLFRATRVTINTQIPEVELQRAAAQVANQVDTFNKREIGKVLSSVLSVDLAGSEPWLIESLNNYVAQNVALIQNVREDFLRDTERVVFDGFRRGLRHEEIAQQILGNVKDKQGFVSRFRKAKTRANLIARDQVNKLNGQLSMLRQQEAGFSRYRWRTVGDSRVRPAHQSREGQIFEWTNPPLDGHPGEPIQCRCWAEPVFSDLAT